MRRLIHCVFMSLLAITIAATSDAGDSAELLVEVRDGATSRLLPSCITISQEGLEEPWGKDAAGEPLRYRARPRIWSTGTERITIPPGDFELTVSRPYEYRLHTERIRLATGEERQIAVRLERIIDLAGRGWFCGDAHQHVVHGEREFAVNIPLAAKISQAEGLDWCVYDGAWSSVEGETGSRSEAKQQAAAVTNRYFAAFRADEYPKDDFGHMAAFPFPTDDWTERYGRNRYEYTLPEREEHTHAEILSRLFDDGGLCIYTHPTREYGGTEEHPANIGRELPYDLLVAPRLVPALDALTDFPGSTLDQQLWMFLLNKGYRIGLAAFNDTCFDRHDAMPGHKRTYVFLGNGRVTAKGLIEAVREGRTFATNGPLVLFDIDGSGPGSELNVQPGPRHVTIETYAPGVEYTTRTGPYGLSEVTLLRNGEPYKQDLLPLKPLTYRAEFEITETEGAWYVVKVVGSGPGRRAPTAYTSPIYFRTEGYQPPEPVSATVSGSITDAETGKKIPAAVEILLPARPGFSVLRSVRAEEGTYSLSCPGTARLRVRAPGYKPVAKSILIDNDALYLDLLGRIRRNDLLDWSFYERIQEALEDVRLDFALTRD